MIVWALILILVSGTGQTASYLATVSATMDGCFRERSELLIEAEWYDGHFPPGSQAICVKMPVKGLKL